MVLINEAQGEPTKKPNEGRQKTNIKRIDNKQKRMVTFSKRRKGLFSKAAQLSQYGGEVAVITFSPGGKAYSTGHPSVDGVVSKYLNEADHSSPDDILSKFVEENDLDLSSSSSTMFDIKEQQLEKEAKSRSEYEAALKELEEAKREGDVIKKQAMNDANNGTLWWRSVDINQLGIKELGEYISAIQGLKGNVSARADQSS